MNGDIVLVTGASRSGKSRFVEVSTKVSTPLIVWDPKAEYDALDKIDFVELRELIGRHDVTRVRYVPTADLKTEFELLCKGVLAWASVCSSIVTFIAEELADVTPPGKACGAWGTICRQGRGRGITIYGITQAPAESDKTIIRNANIIHCCRLGREQDRRYMEKEIGLESGTLDRLEFNDSRGDFVHLEQPGVPKFGSMSFKSGRITW